MHAARSLMILTCCAGGLAAQDPAPAAPKPAAIRYDATTMFLAAGEHALGDVIDAGARFLGGSILTRQNEMKMEYAGPVVLQSDLAFDRDEAEAALASLLYSRGYVLVPSNREHKLYEVVLLGGPRNHEVSAHAPHKSATEILAQPELRMPVTTHYELQRVNANLATNALRPFFAAGGGAGSGLIVGTTGDNWTLVLSGMQHQVAAAIALLRQTDGEPEAPDGRADAQAAPMQQRFVELEKLVAELQARVGQLQQQLADQR